jgi:hypothetical protein
MKVTGTITQTFDIEPKELGHTLMAHALERLGVDDTGGGDVETGQEGAVFMGTWHLGTDEVAAALVDAANALIYGRTLKDGGGYEIQAATPLDVERLYWYIETGPGGYLAEGRSDLDERVGEDARLHGQIMCGADDFDSALEALGGILRRRDQQATLHRLGMV